MNLYKIKFEIKGTLVNPGIKSPIYVYSDHEYDALDIFLKKCKGLHDYTIFTPNNITISMITKESEILRDN